MGLGVVVIGITGPIGSGKSTVSEILRSKGYEVLDMDRWAHRYLEPDQPTYGEIVKAFGRRILDSSGRIDRGRLGAEVFSDREKLESLNRIVHPVLLRDLRQRIAEFRSTARTGVLGIDAALIFCWGLEKECDLVLWMDAPVDIRRQRMVEQKQLSAEQFDQRDRLQSPQFQASRKRSNIVRIENTGSRLELTRRIERLLWEVENHENKKHV
jgi:dephospho-CoA kinase